MSDTSAATPLPAPDAGENKAPEVSLVVKAAASETPETPNTPGMPNAPDAPEESKRRSPSQLNQRQLAETEEFKLIVAAALKPEHRTPLVLRDITDAFLTHLAQDLAGLGRRVTNAVACTTNKEGATLTGADAAETLVNDLREAQAAARLKYFYSDPAKLKNFGIGEPIDANRATLDQTAQNVVASFNRERPAGVDTNFINRIEENRQKVVTAKNQRSSEGGRGKSERELRDEAFAAIRQRVRTIQFAADAAWPAHVPGHGGLRVQFLIPADRPFVA